MSRKPAYRPKICDICHAPLTHATTGRPRTTCSDRCRQSRRRRYDYEGWRDPRSRQRQINRAERIVRKIEREVGSLATIIDEHSPFPNRREHIRIHLIRTYVDKDLNTLTFCHWCHKPYFPR